MIKFFRKIRQNLMNKGEAMKYLKYALGEILLVVIGILIALQINNWNQDRKQKAQLNNIYKIIKQDLITDTLEITNVKPFFKKRDDWMQKIVNDSFPKNIFDTINEENYINCTYCRSPITNYILVNLQDKGYTLLKNLNTQTELDSVSFNIVEFYKAAESNIPGTRLRISGLTDENISYFKQFPWFLDWINMKYNKDNLEFFLNDMEYKKRVAIFQSIYIGNYARLMDTYKTEAKKLLVQLDTKLED